MTRYPRVSVDTDIESGMCFGCGPNNPVGLRLEFTPDGDIVEAVFTPEAHHQGWDGVLHGGIISCLLDEAMAYAARLLARVNCITGKMTITMRCPVAMDAPLRVTGRVVKVSRKLVESRAELLLPDGTVAAEATSKQYVVDGAVPGA